MKPTQRNCTISARVSGSTTSRATCSTTARLRATSTSVSITGLTSNPTIFDEAIGDSERLRRRHPRQGGGGKVRRSAVRRAGAGGPAPCRRSVPPGIRCHRPASTAGSRWKSRRCWPPTPPAAIDAARADPPAGAIAPNLFVKIPGHAGRHSGDRGIDLRRRADQRDAAVLARAICRGRRSVSARHRTAHRSRTRPARRLGRFAVRQPLGQGRERASCPRELRNRLGIAIGQRTYRAYRELLASPRWQKLAAAGATPQRLLWASTGTKDPDASDTLYVEALAAPDTINTMPEKTLHAFAEHGELARRDGEPTAAMRKRCWRASRRPASTSTRSRCQAAARGRSRRSSSRGRSCCSASPTRAQALASPTRSKRSA